MEHYTYEKLVQCVQEGEITWCEFVRLTDFGEAFASWCNAHGIQESDNAAQTFMSMIEERLYDDSEEDYFLTH
ncbi:MAG: hypothetical protein SPF56_10340 [Bacteroidaceae bacterium]|nr:hypothetical protein [Prevotellaceae bacterium]MDY5632865.1 hypothetical protein [Bacteroidaceae bacterium]